LSLIESCRKKTFSKIAEVKIGNGTEIAQALLTQVCFGVSKPFRRLEELKLFRVMIIAICTVLHRVEKQTGSKKSLGILPAARGVYANVLRESIAAGGECVKRKHINKSAGGQEVGTGGG
jgi:hypothetical protein